VNLKGILIVTAASVALALSSSNVPASAFVSDDFSSGTLNPGLWTFVNPLGTARRGWWAKCCRSACRRGATPILPPEKNGARAMQAVGNTDFEVEAKFDSAPSQQYQEQG